MKIFESGEDYLEAILVLSEKNKVVKSIDIVHHMNLSKPSVSVAMKKLKKSGFILIDENGDITLTKEGKQIASSIYERHVFLTKLLVEMGVDENVAAADACKIEHDLSKESFAAIKETYSKLKTK